MISQREVGSQHALVCRGAQGLRCGEKTPDVIVVGELRDTGNGAHVALAASETGHLVLGTIGIRPVPPRRSIA